MDQLDGQHDRMDLTIRTITRDDLPAFRTLATNAGLVAAIDYMGDYLAWQPDGYLCAVDGNGRMVGSAGAQRFGHVAFIGAMCVEPSLQRGGVGGRIFARVLEELRGHGVTTSLLEATAMGAGLYRKHGFITDHLTGIFQRKEVRAVKAHRCMPMTTEDLAELIAFDTARFGAPRTAVITGLAKSTPGRGFLLRGDDGKLRGFILASRLRVGPWIADDEDAAEQLLDAALALPFDAPAVMYASLQNGRAVELLQSRGFSSVRVMDRMRLGPAFPSRSASILALGTAGVG